jgi:hypothetical protein
LKLTNRAPISDWPEVGFFVWFAGVRIGAEAGPVNFPVFSGKNRDRRLSRAARRVSSAGYQPQPQSDPHAQTCCQPKAVGTQVQHDE